MINVGQYKIIDNFLSPHQLKFIQNQMFGNSFPWYYTENINDKDDSNCYFAHNLYASQTTSEFFWPIWDIFSRNTHKFVNENAMFHLIRVKMNCYPRESKDGKKKKIHGFHQDMAEFDNNVALFYVNSTDAPTYLKGGDGQKDIAIEGIENRLLIFHGHHWHASSTPSNAKTRVTININYHEYSGFNDFGKPMFYWEKPNE